MMRKANLILFCLLLVISAVWGCTNSSTPADGDLDLDEAADGDLSGDRDDNENQDNEQQGESDRVEAGYIGSCIIGPGNEFGVGLSCSAGGSECPDGSVCSSDYGIEVPEVCVILDCAGNADCGSDAVCTHNRHYYFCTPICALGYDDYECKGDTGNPQVVGRACTRGGGECTSGAVCLKDYNESWAGICVIFSECLSLQDCEENAACLTEETAVCLPIRCQEFGLDNCVGNEGNELGIGRSCDSGEDGCPGESLCLKDINADWPGVCATLHCSEEGDCGPGSSCVEFGGVRYCLPNHCLGEAGDKCIFGQGNELGVGLSCSAGGEECFPGTVCSLDFGIAGEGFCTMIDCPGDCGTDAICTHNNHYYFCGPICKLNLPIDQCQGDAGNELGIGRTCSQGGGECPEGTECLRDYLADWPGICVSFQCGSHENCGSGSICKHGEFGLCLPLRCLDIDMGLCPGGEGNELGVGRSCSSGGGECPAAAVCLKDINEDWPGICTLLHCTGPNDCGSQANCGEFGGMWACQPENCAPPPDGDVDGDTDGNTDVGIECTGNTGNELGVGRGCTPGLNDCPEGATCAGDLSYSAPRICVIIDCTSDEECGSEAVCVNDGYRASCMPLRCTGGWAHTSDGDTDDEIDSDGDIDGEKVQPWYFAVMADPRGAGSEFRKALYEIRDRHATPFFPEAAFVAIAGDIDPNRDRYSDYKTVFAGYSSMMAYLPVMGNHDFSDTGAYPYGNEIGIGKACTAGGGECPEGTVCAADVIPDTFGFCTMFNCLNDEMCGSLSICRFEETMSLCLMGGPNEYESSYITDVIIPEQPDIVRRSVDDASYYYDTKNVRFIAVDQYTDQDPDGCVDAPLRQWVDESIASADHADHVFISFHEPAFPRYRHQDDSFNHCPADRNAFWDMLLTHGSKVKAVLVGHTHYYYRMRVADPRSAAANSKSAFPDQEGGIYQVDAGSTDGPNTVVKVKIDGCRVHFKVVEARMGAFNLHAPSDEWEIPCATPE